MPAAKIFLDTNILVYFATDSEPEKRDVSADLLKSRPLIGVQVLNEFINVMRNKLRVGWAGLRPNLEIFDKACSVEALTPAIQARAAWIAERHRYHIYDANIIAAAEASGAEILYSEDLEDGRRFGKLKIVNPYV